MRLGLDSYSFHRFYGETTAWETLPETKWSLRDFLNFCDSEEITLASIQTAYMPSDDEVIAELQRWQRPEREIVFTWGHPNGYNGGKNEQAQASVLHYLKLAAKVGATQMRIVLGNQKNFADSISQRHEILRPQLREAAALASELGIRLSIENHADFPVMRLVELIDSVGNPALGLCLDTGNAKRVGDDHLELLRTLDLSRVFMIQLKETLRLPGHEAPTGWWPTVYYGQGDTYADKCLEILRERNFTDPVVIELSNLNTGLAEIEVAKQAIAFARKEMART
jgi:sugar phosphate isomerase/epimerase